MEILVGDVNAKLGREDISNQQLEISLYQDSNNNCITLVNFATSKNQVVKL
jgi:hypothetical protein